MHKPLFTSKTDEGKKAALKNMFKNSKRYDDSPKKALDGENDVVAEVAEESSKEGDRYD